MQVESADLVQKTRENFLNDGPPLSVAGAGAVVEQQDVAAAQIAQQQSGDDLRISQHRIVTPTRPADQTEVESAEDRYDPGVSNTERLSLIHI